MFDADDAGGEADANRIGEGDVGWEGEGDFELGPGVDGAVEVEENAAGADVLSLGLNFGGGGVAGAFESDDGRQPHVEAPHHPPFL